MVLPEKATQRTLYFIGVTTTKSSIMKLYPLWAEPGDRGYGDQGIDIEIHADPQVYRKVVEFIKQDELSMGALVTTHRSIYLTAARTSSIMSTPTPRCLGSLCIAKKNGSWKLPPRTTSQRALHGGLYSPKLLEGPRWRGLIMARRRAIAISSNLLNKQNGANVPSKVIISNRSQAAWPRSEADQETNPEINRDVEWSSISRRNLGRMTHCSTG